MNFRVHFEKGFWRFGPFTYYGWGWDLNLPFKWCLVWSWCGHKTWVYVSRDATPPRSREEGFFLHKAS